jgi:hypothetical protein
MQLKLIFTDAAFFFRKNLNQIAVLCLPWLFAGALVEHFFVTNQEAFGDKPLFFLAWAFNLLVYPIYTAALILLMAQQAEGRRPTNQALLVEAFKRWQPLLILHLLGSLLAGFGILLFVLPGIWVMVRLSFAEFYLVLDDLNPIEAIQKSIQTTKKHWRVIFFLMLMFLFPVAGLTFLFGQMSPDNPQVELIATIAGLAASFYMLFVDVLIFRVYMSAVTDAPAAPDTPDA